VPRVPILAVVISTAIAFLMVLLVLPAASLAQSPATIGNAAVPLLGGPDAILKVPSEYPTIQKAIKAAASGDTILVAPGTYVEQLTIDKSVTIRGSGVGKTVIQSPTKLKPDAFGNPWTIELGKSAKVALSGFTLLVTLHCIIYPADSYWFAGGGIGVGGSAVLDLEFAAITTNGATEGAACGTSPTTAGFMSFGTGVGFGLDYVTGSPRAQDLVGTGTVSGVTISGFGFGGPDVAIGGLNDSPAGSSARLSNDQMTTNIDNMIAFPAISVGYAGNSGTVTIVDNFLTTLPGHSNAIYMAGASSAYIAHNMIIASGGPGGNGIVLVDSSSATIVSNEIIVSGSGGVGIVVAFSSWATIRWNQVTASTTAYGYAGIYLVVASAAISYNTISNFECELDPAAAAPSTCGPDYATQAQGFGIQDFYDAGLGTTIEHNLISENDVGIELGEGCPGCIVSHNTLIDNLDYGLAGVDGSYTFLHNWVIGGMYSVAAIANTLDTLVKLHHVGIVGPSVDPFYLEVDFAGGTATVVGK
jgi:Right handed beta helix region